MLSVAAIATLTSACATFSDSDNVARVGDATLTTDDFESPVDRTRRARPTRSCPVTQCEPRSPRGSRSRSRAPTHRRRAEELAARYDAGFDSSGIVCANGIVVADESTADRVASELDDGAEFDELLVTENLDETLTASGGDVGCVTNEILEQSADIEFIRTASTLSADDAVGTAPLVDQTGAEFAWVVLEFRDFAGLRPADLELVTSTIELADRLAAADVFVDPRYGTFDTTTGQVVGLG
jgi:hypothetical protein